MADSPERQTELTLDLGGERVNLVRLVCSEALSQHFTISLDLLAPLGEIDFLAHLGKPAVVDVLEDNVHQRFFHGILVDAEFIEEIEKRGFHYRIRLRPSAFLHAQGSNCRIFQSLDNKPITTKDIIETIFQECGIDYDFSRVSGSTPARAYCVQYNESNFAFVSRLMEEEGLYYYYDHDRTTHKLTVCDAPGSHRVGKASPLVFNEKSDFVGNVNSAVRFADGQKQFVHSWHERVSSGGERKVTLRDFDFMKPDVLVVAETEAEKDTELDPIEVYSYPARTYLAQVGKARTDALLEGRRAGRRTYSGESVDVALSCGATFVLTDHTVGRFNGSYLLTNVRHTITSEQYASSLSYDDETEIDFEAIPADIQWRAPITTRRPVVRGPETAWITGPKEEEIYTDEYGRVKVQFHWDREGNHDENSSCWVRVSQTGGLGNIILPRVGHEVLVDFIDGDPDRPIVVGRVFNETHRPIYELPKHKTRALWRTKTYKEKDLKPSGAKKPLEDVVNPGCNELRFEDMAGSEEVFLHAQLDMNTRIQRNETHHLGNDLEIDVGQHRTMTIGVDDTVKVGENRETEIGANEKRKVGADRETRVDNNELLDVGQKITVIAGTEIEITAGSKITLTVGQSKIVMKGNQIEVTTGTLKTSGVTVAEHKGGGANKIVMDATGMTINGTLVRIN